MYKAGKKDKLIIVALVMLSQDTLIYRFGAVDV